MLGAATHTAASATPRSQRCRRHAQGAVRCAPSCRACPPLAASSAHILDESSARSLHLIHGYTPGLYNFSAAQWVRDIVTPPTPPPVPSPAPDSTPPHPSDQQPTADPAQLASCHQPPSVGNRSRGGSMLQPVSAPADRQLTGKDSSATLLAEQADPQSIEDLPQGYRTADVVSVFRVPLHPATPAAQPATTPCGAALQGSQLHVGLAPTVSGLWAHLVRLTHAPAAARAVRAATKQAPGVPPGAHGTHGVTEPSLTLCVTPSHPAASQGLQALMPGEAAGGRMDVGEHGRRQRRLGGYGQGSVLFGADGGAAGLLAAARQMQRRARGSRGGWPPAVSAGAEQAHGGTQAPMGAGCTLHSSRGAGSEAGQAGWVGQHTVTPPSADATERNAHAGSSSSSSCSHSPATVEQVACTDSLVARPAGQDSGSAPLSLSTMGPPRQHVHAAALPHGPGIATAAAPHTQPPHTDTPALAIPTLSSAADGLATAMATRSAAQAAESGSMPALDAPDSHFVVCKTSCFKEAGDDSMDTFKYASSMNEWQTFQKFAPAMQHKNLVQLLGWSKTATTVSIISEFCPGGDLQMMLDACKRSPLQPLAPGVAAQLDPHLAHTWEADCCCASPEPPAQHQHQQHLLLIAGDTGAASVAGILGGRSMSEAEPQLLRGLAPRPGARQCRMSEAEAWRVARDVLRGLAAMHRGGLTHGDIKPANIFLSCKSAPARQDLPDAPRLATPSCATSASDASSRSNPSTGTGPPLYISLDTMAHPQAPALPHHSPSTLPSATTAPSPFTSATTAATAATPLRTGPGSPVFPGSAASPASSPGRLQPPWPAALTRYKLGDFGTMREAGRRHLHYFVSGFGYTPSYTCPEALRHGTASTGLSSDLWSIAVVLLHLLLGRLPGLGEHMDRLQAPEQHGEREAWLRAHPPITHALAELAAAGVRLSPELEQVLRACLQVSPTRRPEDASALLQFAWFLQPPPGSSTAAAAANHPSSS